MVQKHCWMKHPAAAFAAPSVDDRQSRQDSGNGMLKKIVLDNYMAHGRTVIEPAAGLTVVVGPNNCGKSAIVHALQTLCYNRPADFAVRHGEKEASVTVETDDGHNLTWRRTRGKVSYLIDGREIGRLGQAGTPDDLHRYLKMPRIEPPSAGMAPFLVHFGLQKAPIFLLDEPGSRAATFFASSSDAEKLVRMQNRHREKTRDARRELDRLTVESEQLDARLRSLELVEALCARIKSLEETYFQIESLDKELIGRRDALNELRARRRRRDRHQHRQEISAALQTPPVLRETGRLGELIRGMSRVGLGRKRAAREAVVCGQLHSPPPLQELRPIGKVIKSLSRAKAQADKAARRGRALSPLLPPPGLADERRLGALVEAMVIAEHTRVKTARAARAFDSLHPAPKMGDQQVALRTFLERFAEAEAKRTAAAREIELAASALKALGDQAAAFVADHPNCPLCGGAIDSETLFSSRHQHA